MRPSNSARAREAQKFASEIVEDPEYRKNLKARAVAGILAPGVETLLLHYRYGKPVEHVELHDLGKVDYTAMSTEELAARAAAVVEALKKQAFEEVELQHQRAAARLVDSSLTRESLLGLEDPLPPESVH